MNGGTSTRLLRKPKQKTDEAPSIGRRAARLAQTRTSRRKFRNEQRCARAQRPGKRVSLVCIVRRPTRSNRSRVSQKKHDRCTRRLPCSARARGTASSPNQQKRKQPAPFMWQHSHAICSRWRPKYKELASQTHEQGSTRHSGGRSRNMD